jgi:hypothetical protein
VKIGVKKTNFKDFPWAIWCNEDKYTAGHFIEHWHDEDGHVFPCTTKDLLGLREAIGALLNIKTAP